MLEQMGEQAKDAAFILAQLNTTEKSCAQHYCRSIRTTSGAYSAANQKDIEIAKQNGLSDLN